MKAGVKGSAPTSLQALVEALRVLPGVGPKSAQRMAYHLLQHDREGARKLGDALRGAADHIRHCQRCNTFTEQEICETCLDERRDAALLCVVETPADQVMIEQTLTYRGKYFVLMGRLSPLDGIGPRELGLDALASRLAAGEVTELIVATSATVEGEATAHYLAQMARQHGARVFPTRAVSSMAHDERVPHRVRPAVLTARNRRGGTCAARRRSSSAG